jgi:predicted nucleotide-binding protein (sugar kinase/HSP70/actin superfamily)
MVKIGIPRALAYYQYYPMWRAFFEKLGTEVVASEPTTKQMLADGAKRVIADTCMPAKVYMGHVLALIGKCDYIFIPVIRSVKPRVFNCAKFLGLPDMTRAVIPGCPPVLEIDFDISKGRDRILRDIAVMVRDITGDKKLVKEAVAAAIGKHIEFKKLMTTRGLTPVRAIDTLFDGEKKSGLKDIAEKSSVNIALVGHHYLLYDEHLNHRIFHRLADIGCRIYTPEMAAENNLQDMVVKLLGRSYWTWEEEVVGAGGYYLEGQADGVIGVSAFGCGPDSLMMDSVRRHALNLGNVPFMNLTLEEHTAEAGIVTRLEAFVDMIRRRKRRLSCA